MMSVNFQDKLKSFEKDKVDDKIVEAMDKYMKANPGFNEENATKAGVASLSLYKWSKAIVNYAKVAKTVIPK